MSRHEEILLRFYLKFEQKAIYFQNPITITETYCNELRNIEIAVLFVKIDLNEDQLIPYYFDSVGLINYINPNHSRQFIFDIYGLFEKLLDYEPSRIDK